MMSDNGTAIPGRLAGLMRRTADRLDPPLSATLAPTVDRAATSVTAAASGCVRFFDDCAGQYDEGAAKYWPIKQYVSQEMSNLERMCETALVVGVGTGQELEALFQKGIPNIEAIDVSQSMLREAERKYPGVTYHCADFLNFSGLHRQEYDLIICCGVVEYVADFPAFLEKASGLLSPGGVMFMTFTPLLPSHPLQSEQVSRHSEYPEFRVYKHRFEDAYSYVQSCGLAIEKCFTFDCHFDDNIDIANICFFCVLERPVRHA